jgi:predicted PurR-regulated permease PerM
MGEEKSPLVVEYGGDMSWFTRHKKISIFLALLVVFIIIVILYFAVFEGFIEKTIRSDPSSDFDMVSAIAKINRKQEEYLNHLVRENN